ncbi:uncharacterized protein FRV6_10926 [Fusarium oxysporum]|uniref:Uncharacterized protein n=1 Tax=Fusarium oxysporum TaxID=5507 RepID=A0A2H3TXZ5_FUSOX|nr:uncharacterized protein FRV6_10926 [Fusarium oxysporum]
MILASASTLPLNPIIQTSLVLSNHDQDVSSRLAPAFAFHIISMMIQNENDKHMSELTLRRQFIYPLIEMLHDTILKSSLHLLSHGLDHSLGFTIKTFSKSSIVDGVDSRHVLPLMTNLSSDKL